MIKYSVLVQTGHGVANARDIEADGFKIEDGHFWFWRWVAGETRVIYIVGRNHLVDMEITWPTEEEEKS